MSSPSSPATTASVFGFVIDAFGACIEGATVQVVGDQGIGQSVVQTTPCDAWAYGNGFEFHNLAPGIEMRLRASAQGWSTEETTSIPQSGARTAIEIVLKKRPLEMSRQ